jgi:hypothetical protein
MSSNIFGVYIRPAPTTSYISDDTIKEYIELSQIMTYADFRIFDDPNAQRIRECVSDSFRKMNDEEKQIFIGRLNEQFKTYNISSSIPETTITTLCNKCNYYVVDKMENYKGAYARVCDYSGPGCVICSYADNCLW